MKLSELQAQILLEVLRSTLEFEIPNSLYDRDNRVKLYEDIINQQSRCIVDLGSEKSY